MRAFAYAPKLSLPFLLMMSLLRCPFAHAERSCRMAIPEIRFQVNSIEPVRGIHDLGCVVRSLHADSALSTVAEVLRENPAITLGLVGHADMEEEDGQGLSVARARWAACMLVSLHGIEPGRLAVEGMGDDRPRITTHELRKMTRAERVQARQHNRRVEFLITGFAWVPAQVDEISAVRFLSDPAPARRPSENSCEQQQAAFTCGTRDGTGSEEETSDLEDALPTIGEREETPDISEASKLAEPEPSLLTNPIDGDRIIIVGLPDGPRGGQAEVLTLDGRSLYARSFARILAGERETIDLPSLPADSAYIVRVTIGARSWSLRFVKR